MKAIEKILIFLYITVLTQGILLKFRIGLPWPMEYRSLNLIPYAEIAQTVGSQAIDWREIVFNIVAFTPLGFFLRNSRAKRLLVTAICLSLVYEATQYLLAIGMADITDVIHNILGAYLGFLMGKVLRKNH